MNPFVTTKPQTITYNMVQRFFPQMNAALNVHRELLEKFDVNEIAADFGAAETAGGADIGTPVNYGGYDSKDIHRWMKFIEMYEAFLDTPATVVFADTTEEVTDVRGLMVRDYLPFVEPEV
jgi:hypothetical protein